ncbi:hypothetical protein SpCBS45565_g03209 [Spizellomyces sp. 'palustris']|nr:hypothetical protein SpCBS45565_g03209 [Spizellomyces sp. 'palustris']
MSHPRLFLNYGNAGYLVIVQQPMTPNRSTKPSPTQDKNKNTIGLQIPPISPKIRASTVDLPVSPLCLPASNPFFQLSINTEQKAVNPQQQSPLPETAGNILFENSSREDGHSKTDFGQRIVADEKDEGGLPDSLSHPHSESHRNARIANPTTTPAQSGQNDQVPETPHELVQIQRELLLLGRSLDEGVRKMEWENAAEQKVAVSDDVHAGNQPVEAGDHAIADKTLRLETGEQNTGMHGVASPSEGIPSLSSASTSRERQASSPDCPGTATSKFSYPDVLTEYAVDSPTFNKSIGIRVDVFVRPKLPTYFHVLYKIDESTGTSSAKPLSNVSAIARAFEARAVRDTPKSSGKSIAPPKVHQRPQTVTSPRTRESDSNGSPETGQPASPQDSHTAMPTTQKDEGEPLDKVVMTIDQHEDASLASVTSPSGTDLSMDEPFSPCEVDLGMDDPSSPCEVDSKRQSVTSTIPLAVCSAASPTSPASVTIINVLPFARRSSIIRVPCDPENKDICEANESPDQGARVDDSNADEGPTETQDLLPNLPVRPIAAHNGRPPRLPDFRFSNVPLRMKLNLPLTPRASIIDAVPNTSENPPVSETLPTSADRVLECACLAISSTHEGADHEGTEKGPHPLAKSISLGSVGSATSGNEDDLYDLKISTRFHETDCTFSLQKNRLVCTDAKGKRVSRHFPLHLSRVLISAFQGQNIVILAAPHRKYKSGPKLRQIQLQCADEIASEEWVRRFNWVVCNGNFDQIVNYNAVLIIDETDEKHLRAMIDKYVAPILQCVGKPFEIIAISPHPDHLPKVDFQVTNFAAYLTRKDAPSRDFEGTLLKSALTVRKVNLLTRQEAIDPVDFALMIIKEPLPTCQSCIAGFQLKRAHTTVGGIVKMIRKI